MHSYIDFSDSGYTPNTVTMADGKDVRSGSAYSDKWAKLAQDSEKEIDEEDKALKEQADKALGLGSDKPKSQNEANAHSQKEALKAAKDTWKEREDQITHNKVWVEDLKGETKAVAADDDHLHAVHVRNCTDCTLTIPASMKVVKVFFEGCKNTRLSLHAEMVTETLEVWRCDNSSVEITAKTGTIQADICTGTLGIKFASKRLFGSIYHAGVETMEVSFGDGTPVHVTNAAALFAQQSSEEKEAAENALAKSKGAVMAQTADESQFVTHIVKDNVCTERVVRGADEYPSTLRELKEKGFEASAALIENEAQVLQMRAVRRREKGNEAFKEQNFPQAATSYTEALALWSEDHITLTNRAAAFLKMGHPEKALKDSEAAIAAEPKWVKAHFRKGLSLHALGRYADAVQALGIASGIDDKNKQVNDAIKMAEYMARKHGGNKTAEAPKL